MRNRLKRYSRKYINWRLSCLEIKLENDLVTIFTTITFSETIAYDLTTLELEK
jgi:hypothetical protein